MKYGWKTRIEERRYFEEKIQARKRRIEQIKSDLTRLKQLAFMAKRKEPFLNKFISIDPNEQKEMIHGKQWL